jgi:hypothetical protein
MSRSRSRSGWAGRRLRSAAGAVREQVVVAAVGLLGGAHAGVLAHGPEAAAVHGGLDAAGVGLVLSF